MFESFTLEAPGAALTVGMEDAAVRVTAQEWPTPKMTPHTAAGGDGPVRIDTAADRGERTVALTVDCGGGNVTGDAGGLAVNRVGGRDVESAAASSTIDWPVYTGDGVPAMLEAGATVRLSSPGTVRVELRRGSSVLAFKDVHVQPGRRATVRVPAAATTGSGSVVLRVSAPTHVSGATLEATLPLVGVGLDGVYHDAAMPGTTLVDAATGASQRPAGGEEWARAFLSGLAEVNGAVGSRPGTLTVTNRAGDDYTFALAAVDPEHELLPEFYGGQTSVKLALQCSAYAEGPQVTLSGTLATVNGLKVWTGSSAVPGDVPALLDVAAAFGTTPRPQITASAPTGAPTVIAGTTLAATTGTSTTATIGGSGNATVRRFLTGGAPTATPVTSFVPATSGRFDVTCRVYVESSVLGANLSLMVGAATVASRVLPSAPSGWVSVRFGPQTLTASETVYLAPKGVSSFLVDWVSIEPSGGPSAVVEARPPVPPMLVAGDDALQSTVAFGSTINAKTGVFGGTWAASGWNRVNADVPTQRPIGFQVVSGAAATIGTVAKPWRQIVQLWVSYASSTSLTLNVAGNVVTLAVSGLWTITTEHRGGNMTTTATDDSYGMYSTAVTTSPAWSSAAAVPFTLSGFAGGQTAVVTSLRLYQLTEYSATVRWNGGGTGELVAGGLPTVAAGSTPRLALVAGGNKDLVRGGIDFGATGPTSVVVKATPRYLAVPGGA